MRTVFTLLLAIIIFSPGLEVTQAEAKAAFQPDFKLTAVSMTPFVQTDVFLMVADNSSEAEDPAWSEDDYLDESFHDPFQDDSIRPMPDPLERVNRPLFTFNDKLYFWLLKPVSQGYGWIMPKPARKSVKKFFYNLRSPIRMVNCLLQEKGCGALYEFYRFGINTTIGIAGFFDPATSCFHLESHNQDFGLTLGHLTGPGFYLNLPFMGPSSLRDGIGSFVDTLIVPTWYVVQNYGTVYTLVRVFEAINTTSLTIGEYEDLKEASIDPYISIRDAYHQHREDMIKR